MFELIFEGLENAYKNHVSLGENGRAKDKINGFGDMALRADGEAEEKITESLQKFAIENNTRVICKSEELGDQEINPKGAETYFAVFDGLDGSSNYLKIGEWGYGTMWALAKNEKPTYDDFEIAGIAMMEQGKILISQKGIGLTIINMTTMEKVNMPKFDLNETYDHSKILANKAFPEEIAAIGENSNDWPMTGSTAASIVTICTGEKWQGLVEVTRKNNLEQPILFVMIESLGGVMVNHNGNSIGPNEFKDWAQKKVDGSDDRQLLITARNQDIVKGIINELNLDIA
jgi:fructose-1,6-bisphosphatase/inositol monophosphatase family enzyme